MPNGAPRIACAVTALLLGVSPASGQPTDGPVAEIQAVLDDMVEAWNADDLEGHVAAYADDATYVTPPRVLTGRAEITASLRGFEQNGELVGTLRFTEVSIRMLGASHALIVGRFTLDGSGGGATGRFTLVARRVGDEWVMLHDHSS